MGGWGAVAWVVALVLVASGCLMPIEPGVFVPDLPESLEAAYRVSWAGKVVAVAHAVGLADATGYLGDGSEVTLPGISITIRTGGAFWGELYHGLVFRTILLVAPGGRIATMSITCEKPPSAPAEASCSLNNPRLSIRHVPDAIGTPAGLGLGFFSGKRIGAGELMRAEVWDPSGNVSVSWRAGNLTTDPSGRECVSLEAVKPDGPKTPILFAPIWGRLVACDGLPLPVEMETGPLRLTLENFTAAGILSAPPSPRVPLQRGNSPCTVMEPAYNRTVLPVGDWLRWGRQNDSYVRTWFEAHPKGVAMAGYGKWELWDQQSYTLPTQLGRGGSFPAPLRLVDYAGNQMEARSAIEDRYESRYVGSGEWTGTHKPSTGRGTSYGLSGQSPDCYGTLELAPLANRLLALMGGPFRWEDAVVEPEAWEAPGLGTQESFSPFGLRPELGQIVPSSWPLRIIARANWPDNTGPMEGVREARFGAADPGSGWIRWFDDARPDSAP